VNSDLRGMKGIVEEGELGKGGSCREVGNIIKRRESNERREKGKDRRRQLR
jgi:hypothetical protein